MIIAQQETMLLLLVRYVLRRLSSELSYGSLAGLSSVPTCFIIAYEHCDVLAPPRRHAEALRTSTTSRSLRDQYVHLLIEYSW